MVRLWSYHRSNGLLPDAGGVLDQAAIMLDAFAIMNGMAERFGK